MRDREQDRRALRRYGKMVRQLGYHGHWEHGFANAGDPEAGRLGEPNGRLVLRSASRRFFQHVPPLHLAVPALPAVHDLPGI